MYNLLQMIIFIVANNLKVRQIYLTMNKKQETINVEVYRILSDYVADNCIKDGVDISIDNMRMALSSFMSEFYDGDFDD